MKLTEFTKTYPLDPNVDNAARQYYDTRQQDESGLYDKDVFDERLKALGWRKTGKGAFSSVYTNASKKFILKVNDHFDVGFAWFAFLTKKFPNKFYPKIGNAKIYRVGQKKYYIYLIEKLEPIPDWFTDIVWDFSWIAKNYNKPVSELIHDKTNLEYFGKRPELVKALQNIGKYNRAYKVDIHKNNVMVRGRSIPVIIDPYADMTDIDRYDE